ncbi:MAG: ABC transporter permease [Planctomycetota bacterium]
MNSFFNFLYKIIKPIDQIILNMVAYVGGMLYLIRSFAYWFFIAPLRGRGFKLSLALGQMSKIGYHAIPICVLIIFLIGFSMAIASSDQLKRFGASIFLADIIGVAITQEMSPIITAIVVAGRSGSAIAAEIGTMMVTEEVVALKAMGLNPIKMIVVPRVFAMIMVLPCLTLLGDIFGCLAGALVAFSKLDVGFSDFYRRLILVLNRGDYILLGIQKSIAFAFTISLVACYRGFEVSSGADAVGKATTSSVVDSIFLIIMINTIFTYVNTL